MEQTLSGIHLNIDYCSNQASSYVPLSLGREPAFYQGEPAATHAFVPCGHVCSEETVRYRFKQSSLQFVALQTSDWLISSLEYLPRDSNKRSHRIF